MGRTILVVYGGLGMAVPRAGFDLVAYLEGTGIVEIGPAGSQRLVRYFTAGKHRRHPGYSLSLRFQQKISFRLNH